MPLIKDFSKVFIDTSTPDEVRSFLSENDKISEESPWIMVYKDNILLLENKTDNLKFSIDFLNGEYSFRKKNTGYEPLLNAIKIKSRLPESLLDTTPGCLRDGFLLASRGIRVVAVERNPILYIILYFSLKKYKSSFCDISIDLIFADSSDYIENTKEEYDLLYLDPIFPEKRKTALVKKEMRIIKTFVGDDSDAPTLLDKGISYINKNNKRLVVKRPQSAPYLGSKIPSFSKTSPKTRFDIYLAKN